MLQFELLTAYLLQLNPNYSKILCEFIFKYLSFYEISSICVWISLNKLQLLIQYYIVTMLKKVSYNDRTYYLVKKLGNGTFGQVHLTKDNFAIKEIDLSRKEFSNNYNKLAELLNNEINNMKKVQHKNVVKFIDYFRSNEKKSHFIIMEYCQSTLFDQIKKCRQIFRKEAGLLAEKEVAMINKSKTKQLDQNECDQILIKTQNRLLKEQKLVIDQREAIQLFGQIFDGYYNGLLPMNIVHRDLKPANIFITQDRILKIGDLGFSKASRNNQECLWTNLGTPYYSAPEVFYCQKYTNKCDIWSLGVILHEMLTGKPVDAINSKIQYEKMCKYNTQIQIFNFGNNLIKQIPILIRKMVTLKPENRISWSQLSREYTKIVQLLRYGIKQEHIPQSQSLTKAQHYQFNRLSYQRDSIKVAKKEIIEIKHKNEQADFQKQEIIKNTNEQLKQRTLQNQRQQYMKEGIIKEKAQSKVKKIFNRDLSTGSKVNIEDRSFQENKLGIFEYWKNNDNSQQNSVKKHEEKQFGSTNRNEYLKQSSGNRVSSSCKRKSNLYQKEKKQQAEAVYRKAIQQSKIPKSKKIEQKNKEKIPLISQNKLRGKMQNAADIIRKCPQIINRANQTLKKQSKHQVPYYQQNYQMPRSGRFKELQKENELTQRRRSYKQLAVDAKIPKQTRIFNNPARGVVHPRYQNQYNMQQNNQQYPNNIDQINYGYMRQSNQSARNRYRRSFDQYGVGFRQSNQGATTYQFQDQQRPYFQSSQQAKYPAYQANYNLPQPTRNYSLSSKKLS